MGDTRKAESATHATGVTTRKYLHRHTRNNHVHATSDIFYSPNLSRYRYPFYMSGDPLVLKHVSVSPLSVSMKLGSTLRHVGNFILLRHAH